MLCKQDFVFVSGVFSWVCGETISVSFAGKFSGNWDGPSRSM